MVPASDQKTHIPGTADLDNPLYYLENFETVVRWVRHYHSDLLTADEIGHIDNLLTLDQPARALLARMVMRTGELFRVEKLRYPELGAPVTEATNTLLNAGWINDTPELPL
ncbi:MAG: VRR-NUC domain-containing protein, partial [Marinobacter sp.]